MTLTCRWVDKDGDGCEAYKSCNDGGWNDRPGVNTNSADFFMKYAVNGVSARDACCHCGKGFTGSYRTMGAGFCRGPGPPGSAGYFVNGRAKDGLDEAECANTCNSLPACVGYAHSTPTYNHPLLCTMYGATLAVGLPASAAVVSEQSLRAPPAASNNTGVDYTLGY